MKIHPGEVILILLFVAIVGASLVVARLAQPPGPAEPVLHIP